MPRKRSQTPSPEGMPPAQTLHPGQRIDAAVVQDLTLSGHIPPGTSHSLRQALDIPLWHDIVVLTLHAPPVPPYTWDDFAWEFTGTWPQPEGTTMPNTFSCDLLHRCTSFPWVYERCRRITHRTSSLWVESVWRPATDTKDTIQGLRHLRSQASLPTHLALMVQAYHLLRAMQPIGGRHKGTQKMSRAAFETCYPDTYNRLRDAYDTELRIPVEDCH